MTTQPDPLKPMETPDELPVRAGYAAWAACYDDDGNPLIALEGPAMQEWFGPLDRQRALDLGCGTGRHTAALVAAGAHVAALDFTPEMIDQARRKPSLQNAGQHVVWIRHALPRPLPFRDQTFHLAVLGLVVEHLDDDALTASFGEAARVLVPGGRCLVSALHPDRTAQGQRARFIDPVSGIRRPIRTYHRLLADYHRAAGEAGLILDGEQVLVVPATLAERLPRAHPYVGQKLGWVACWRRLEPGVQTYLPLEPVL
jgi:SAM-dependent methyltransferase